MAGTIDLKMLENRAAKEASAALTTSLKAAFSAVTTRRTGEGEKVKVSGKFKQDRLDRLSISAPHHFFIQNNGYGLEGQKKTSINKRMAEAAGGTVRKMDSKNFINEAINAANVLETLADKIAEIRGEEVIAAIKF